MKELVRGNKEALDKIIEDNKISAQRMEAQLEQLTDKIGDKISTTVGGEIANLARIMTQFIVKKDEKPKKTKNRKENQSEEDDEKIEDDNGDEEEEEASLPCAQGTYRKTQQSQNPGKQRIQPDGIANTRAQPKR